MKSKHVNLTILTQATAEVIKKIYRGYNMRKLITKRRNCLEVGPLRTNPNVFLFFLFLPVPLALSYFSNASITLNYEIFGQRESKIFIKN